jgi:hypothetical protein
MLVFKLTETQCNMSWKCQDLLLCSSVESKVVVIKLLCEFEFVSLYSFLSFHPSSGLLVLPLLGMSLCQC